MTTHPDPHPSVPNTEPSSQTPTGAPAQPQLGQDGRQAEEIFSQTVTFAGLGLRNSVLKGIEEAGFKYPTTIQATLIPVILEGKDVLGQAKTGTGKTAAFALPMLHRLERGKEFQGLVLVPTRELALQVSADINELGAGTPIRASAVIGGERIHEQAKRLKGGGGGHGAPEILVATPGRIMDLHERGIVHYKNVSMMVLDEVDRMLDIGFRDDIKRILRSCPAHPARQTIFVSATISSDIEALARTHAHNATKIVATSGSLTVSLVKQYHLPVQRWDKKRLLAHLLTHEEPALTVVFCRMKRTVDDLEKYLKSKGIESHTMHGDMYQSKRNKVMDRLRAGTLSVLIASDLASRGLDVEGITHVINYDLPEDPEIYVHRVGRTARAGRAGVAWSFVTPEEGKLLTQIELFINTEVPKLEYSDFTAGPVPDDVRARAQIETKRAEIAQSFNRFSSPAPAPSAKVAAAPDPTKFPGGIVPTKLPPKRMQGHVKTSRSMKAAVAEAMANPTQPPKPS